MNNTITRVLELESKFENIKDCTLAITIEVPQAEMRDAAIYLKNCHLYEPFEFHPAQDYYYFYYVCERNKGLTINVNSIERFRLKREITEWY